MLALKGLEHQILVIIFIDQDINGNVAAQIKVVVSKCNSANEVSLRLVKSAINKHYGRAG